VASKKKATKGKKVIVKEAKVKDAKKPKVTKIELSEESEKDVIEVKKKTVIVTSAHKDDDKSESSEDMDLQKDDKSIEDDKTDSEQSNAKDDDSFVEDEDKDKWHELDNAKEPTPVLGDNQWQTANIDSEDDDIDRPEWDDEKWQQANIDEETPETSDYDANTEELATVSESADVDETETSEAFDQPKASSKTETEVDLNDLKGSSDAKEESDKDVSTIENTEETVSDNNKSELEEESKDDETKSEIQGDDLDSRSASAVALNVDEPYRKKTKLSLKTFPSYFINWWKTARLRNSLISAAIVILLVIISIPTPRYAALNSVGVRATASMTILDSETKLPLRSVDVELAGIKKQTNDNGLVIFDNVKLGKQKIKIIKSAYDSYTEDVTIVMGSNKIKPVFLVAVGKSFNFKISDWLSKKAINTAEVSFQSNSSYANDDGVVILNVPTATDKNITVVISAQNYLKKTLKIDTTNDEQKLVSLVPDKAHYFISKRNGNYDVYKINVDGSDEELIIEGTGSEGRDIQFDVSPSAKNSILVATRDPNIKNSDGFIMAGLYDIDNHLKSIKKVDSSERINIVGWIGDTVIYVKVQAGASGQNPNRHRLMSYNTLTGDLIEIAASNYFNDVLVAKDYVFYAPSDAYKLNPKAFLYRSNSNGTQNITVVEKVVWQIIRVDYDDIYFNSDQDWYKSKIDQTSIQELNNKPTYNSSRLYSLNSFGDVAGWVDQRDGKGNLIIFDSLTNTETTLVARGGLRDPIVWVNDSQLIYRVVTSDETADYIISTEPGSKPVKITDVTNVTGADGWYYYY